jgi:hypothetical protein
VHQDTRICMAHTLLQRSQVFEHQICSEESVDCHRFKDIIDAAVVEGRVESTAAYQKWAAKVLKKKQHKDPLSWPPKDTRNKGEDLALTIRCTPRFLHGSALGEIYIFRQSPQQGHTSCFVSGLGATDFLCIMGRRTPNAQIQDMQLSGT